VTDKVWTPVELVRWTTGYFKENGIPSARLDAELLLACALGVERIELYTGFDRPVEVAERDRFRALVRERAQNRRPVAYLTGVREFWSRPVRVDERVLIPRPDTELLVREAIALAPARVAEIGVGSGAVLMALALELADAELSGTDLSASALEVARANLEAAGVLDRCRLVEGDLAAGLDGPFDVVVSNPPYVPTADLAGLGPEVQHEPALALDGGPDGLDVVRGLAKCAPSLVAPGGTLLIEIGVGQAEPAAELLAGAGARSVRTCLDLAGIPRVVAASFGEEA